MDKRAAKRWACRHLSYMAELAGGLGDDSEEELLEIAEGNEADMIRMQNALYDLQTELWRRGKRG